MELIELHEYMTGEKTFKKKRLPNRPNLSEMKQLINNVLNITGAKENLETVETSKHFFDLNPVLKIAAPTRVLQDEVFYALKSGHYSPEIPSKIIYAAQEALSTGSVNNFGVLFTKKEYETIFAENYLPEGYTMYDAICSVVGEFNLLKPWARSQPSIAFQGFSEVYVPSEKYVATVPTSIAEKLTEEDIEELNVKKGRLHIGDIPLLHLGEYVGVSSATFDLRDAR